MQPTRLQILEILKRQGQATVEGLARELGITLMAVRLHLVVLERDNLVSRTSLRMGPGRPTLIYRLTAAAEDVFPKAYDELAAELLSALRRAGGSPAVETICQEAAAGLGQNLRERLAATGAAAERQVAGYAQLMTRRGHVVEYEQAENGYFVYSYTCPFYRVAQTHREVCVLHRDQLREAMNAEIEMISCLLDGDLRCSHLVRVPVPSEAPGETSVGPTRVPAP